MEKLKIYFTSDVHGYIFPTDYRDQDTKALGFLNIMEEFHKDGNTLIIDGGDTIQGSPFATYLSNLDFDYHPMAEVMNEVGYDYITLGNHDFNYGYDYLKKYVNNLNAKCLCANVTDISNGIPILSYDIKQMANGLTVGVIGFTTDFIPVWEKEEHLTNFQITDAHSSIKDAYEKLKEEVDLLVGIYHGGFEYDLENHKKLSDTSENIAYAICKDYDFDILLTGHQHMEIEGKYIHGTYIAQPPHYGRKYIDMDITFQDSKIKKITSCLKEPGLQPHEKMYNKMIEIENKVQQWLDQPVGFLDMELHPKSHLEMALHGSYLANFINQIQLEISGADISCTSFANSVKGFDKEVTIRDIVSTYIYPNTLLVLEITGQDLLLALERCASYFCNNNGSITISDTFLKPKVEHYNYDYFSNIYYTFDLTKEVGNRVVDAEFNGKNILQNEAYTLVMNNYRASGTGGYDFYEKAKIIKEIQIVMPEIVINYFQKHKKVVVDKTQYMNKPIS
ncbi:MAG: bifunctional metallophosphatase/5'-nucleotidase [Clostridiaceae bacterium]|nr:bifunctional metallophosphatase/5'-nucleotidase [Clostridiaceae bacterium]